MRQRWEHILNRAEQEAPRAAAEARTSAASSPVAGAAARTDASIQSAPTQQMPTPGNGAGSYAPETGRY